MVAIVLASDVKQFIISYFRKSITNNTFDTSVELRETILKNMTSLTDYIFRCLKKNYGNDATRIFEFMFAIRIYLQNKGAEDEDGQNEDEIFEKYVRYTNREILSMFTLVVEERYREDVRNKLEDAFITANEIVLK